MPSLNAFTCALGDLVVRYEAERFDPRVPLAERYAPFECASEPELTVRWVAGEEAGEESANPAARLHAEPVEIELAGQSVRVRSRSIHAVVDLSTGRGELSAPLHRHGADILGRALLAAARPESLLVHAALVVDGERAFLCAGPSGSGKSTLARQLGERARCDELVRLDRHTHGWRAAALPFWHGRPGGGDLIAIRLLRPAATSPEVGLIELSPSEARRRLAAELVWPSFSAAHVERALDGLDRLLLEVSVAELRLRLDSEIWPLLSRRAA